MTRAADLAKLIAGGGSITVDDNATTLSLVSTDADANSGPVQVLYRNSSSPADSDLVGEMHFRGRNDNSQDVEYVTISTRMEDVSDGTEDGKIILKTIVDGTARSRIEIDHTDVVINQDSIDSNFRVESNNQAGMIFVDAGNDRVGIGTVSPNHDLHLHKSTSDGNFLLITNSTTGSNSNDGAAIGLAADETLLIYHQESSDIRFGTGATERMRIDSSGQVGIGTTSPDADLSLPSPHFNSGGTGNGIRFQNGNNDADAIIQSYYSGTNASAILSGQNVYLSTSASLTNFDSSKSSSYILQNTNGDIEFGNASSSAPSERMRIESSGNVLIGQTSTGGKSGLSILPNLDDGACRLIFDRNSSTATSLVIEFENDDARVGQIEFNNSGTSYVTSSDYRLKENIVTDWDATTRLKQLKPSRFNFIADADTTVDGFLAHEVSSIVPEAVSGEKDSVDEDGNIDPQGIDQAKLVPLMVKTIQELEARIATLESK